MNKIYGTLIFLILISFSKAQNPSGIDVNPNPFPKRTLLTYTILVSDTISVFIVNELGQNIDTLWLNHYKIAGNYQDSIIMDDKPNGIYFAFIKDKTKLIISAKLVKTGTTSIPKIAYNSTFRVYPNPVTDKLIIESENISVKSEFKITNVLGQNVYYASDLDTKKEIDFSSLPRGIYFLKLTSNSGQQTIKLIKE